MNLETELIEALLESSISSYKISAETGISRQMIGKLRNGQADYRKGSLENALLLYAFALQQKKEGILVNETETLSTIEVTTKEALFSELKKKKDEILVTGPLAAEMIAFSKTQLSDTERMGAELGSSGLITLAEHLITNLLEAGEPVSKEEKKIRRIVTQLYYIKKISEAVVLLRLKQLDY